MVDSSYYTKRTQYHNFRNSMITLVNHLKESKKNIIDCNRVDSFIMIDDDCNYKKDFDNNCSNIENYINTIEKNIIPSIDKKINDLNKEIAALEMVEE